MPSKPETSSPTIQTATLATRRASRPRRSASACVPQSTAPPASVATVVAKMAPSGPPSSVPRQPKAKTRLHVAIRPANARRISRSAWPRASDQRRRRLASTIIAQAQDYALTSGGFGFRAGFTPIEAQVYKGLTIRLQAYYELFKYGFQFGSGSNNNVSLPPGDRKVDFGARHIAQAASDNYFGGIVEIGYQY